MRQTIDLHTHSTASDGAMPPADLVALADRKRLAALALTDHDTIAGLSAAAKAAAAFSELIFIPGVEISAAFPNGTLHILGLGVDPNHDDLIQVLKRLRIARNQRNTKMIARLQQLGLDISMQEVLAYAGQNRTDEPDQIISRVHMAEALRRKGLVQTAKQAFQKYLGPGTPGYIAKDRLSPAEAIGFIRRAGGVAALAHPVQLRYGNWAELERILRELIDLGLESIEAYHTDHTPDQTRHYLDLARRNDLLVVGGSDFHGSTKAEAKLGQPRVPVSCLTESRFANKLLTIS